MFKSSRWRSEKNKIKAVFKLQFYATQVSVVGVDALVVSVVPADVGKPTVKLEKATIHDGCCYWDNPVYETVKFVRDPKSGKIHERIYHFVVSNGSAKGGVIGDASMDMSCYVLATKSSSVSLQLKGSKPEVLLHVSIQRMTDSLDERGSEESESISSQDRSLRAQMSNEDMSRICNVAPFEDTQVSNPSSKVEGNRRASNGSDLTLSSTDSSLGVDTPRDILVKNDNIHQNGKSFFSSEVNGSALGRSVSDESAAAHDERQKSWEWLGGLALESSTDDSSDTPREDHGRADSVEIGGTEVEGLKRDLAVMSRQAEMSELELQALRKQIVKESRRCQDLLKEITKLKQERDVLKDECEKLKSVSCNLDEATAEDKMLSGGSDPLALLKELRQELDYEKDLNNNLRIQLQKMQESNSELLLAVHDLDEMLEHKNKEVVDLLDKSTISGSLERLLGGNSLHETVGIDEELKASEDLMKEHTDAKDLHELEQKIMDLQREIEIYRREKEEIEVQMEQLALDYEISKQENHEMSYKLEQSQLQEQLKMHYECSSSYAALNELENQIENLENELSMQSQKVSDSVKTIGELESQVKDLKGELEKRSQEHSHSVIAVKELEFQVKCLEDELEKQAEGFEADLESLTCAKIEQEQRAIQAEEALAKKRWQNVNAAERLQDEFRKLSLQMASSLEANEGLAAKALTEAKDLRLQKSILEGKLKKASESGQLVREQYKVRLRELSCQVVTMANQIQELQSEANKKSEELENEVKRTEETQKRLEQEIIALKMQIGTLETENRALSKQAEERESLMSELDHKKRLFYELEALLEKCKKEKTELEMRIALVKGRAEESLQELRRTTCLMDEKDSKAKELQLEVDNLKAECNQIKQLLSDDEFEKEKLRKQVYQLRNDLMRKEGSLNSCGKNLKECIADGSSYDRKEISNLKEKIELLEGQIKQKESALESSTNAFLVKEQELHRKIEDLEHTLGVLNHSSRTFSEQNLDKEIIVREDVNVTFRPRPSDGSISPTSVMSTGDDSEEKNMKSWAVCAGQLNELLGEMGLLKEKNKEMESELKEMQDRYSEISLKFAEVEGERQQLVMKLRNLKNAKKNPSAFTVS